MAIEIYNASACGVKGLARRYSLHPETLWLWIKGERKPQKQNLPVFEKIIEEMKANPRLKCRQSWGYATDDQVRKLNSMQISPERTALIKQVKSQQELFGKYET